jgi:benzoyl-CoA reductase/2-hydroxyglutaryl-CoA dehydratase subunit BcrC/BadD/HgdB
MDIMAEETREQQKAETSGIKATETARSVSAMRRAYYKRVMEAPDRGEFVAWAMWGLPEEICYAMDVLPVLAENYGPVCAAKQMGPHFCEVAESDGFSMDICSYLRTAIGLAKRMHDLGEPPPEAPYGGMGKPDMLIGNAQVCDGRYKYLQVLGRYVDVPFFAYDVGEFPAGGDFDPKKDPEVRKYYVEYYLAQLKRLVAFIEKVTGKKLDKYRLSEALQNWMKVQKLFHDAGQLRKHHPNPLPAQDSATIAFPNLHMKCWPETVDFYQGLYDELKYRVEHNMSSLPEEKYRLLWHLIIPWYYIGLYNWLEQEFGATTMNPTYEGGDVPDQDIIDYDFPLESIARKMYNKRWGVNAAAGDTISSQVDFVLEYDIDGVISLMVASCRQTAHVINTWRRFTDRLKVRGVTIPTLGIEADMVDTRTYSDALVKDQIRAFMETVDAAKRERGKAV